MNGNAEIVELLLEAGAEVDARDEVVRTCTYISVHFSITFSTCSDCRHSVRTDVSVCTEYSTLSSSIYLLLFALFSSWH
jgi:hypothetical protein